MYMDSLVINDCYLTAQSLYCFEGKLLRILAPIPPTLGLLVLVSFRLGKYFPLNSLQCDGTLAQNLLLATPTTVNYMYVYVST